MRPSKLTSALFVLVLSVPLGLAAQMPQHSGKGSVTEAVDTDKGAIFDIGKGVTMMFPKGIGVGHSRLLTLRRAKKKPKPAQILKGFKPEGPALDFNGALNAADTPIVLSLAMKREPKKKGMKLVVAMEIGTFCEGANKKYKLKSGLCSGWEFHTAEYDPGGQRLRAKLGSTGGLRLQFGWVPEDTETR
jgi:hypothetical protein